MKDLTNKRIILYQQTKLARPLGAIEVKDFIQEHNGYNHYYCTLQSTFNPNKTKPAKKGEVAISFDGTKLFYSINGRSPMMRALKFEIQQ